MATNHFSPLFALVLGAWPALSSCLSIEEVPRVSAPGSDKACFDRGVYAIGEYKDFRGLAATCDGKVACVAGTCSPLPPCTPTDREDLYECSFTPQETRGEVGGFTMAGEYVYWTELGTFDGRKNYQGDGAIARARVGEWLREELYTDLDFYNEVLEKARTTKLAVRGDHLFLLASDDSSADDSGGADTAYRGRFDGKMEIDDDEEPLEIGCVVGDQQYWVDGKSLFKRSLEGRGTSPKLIAELSNSGLQCAAVIGKDVFVTGRGSIVRITDSVPIDIAVLTPSATLLGAYKGELVAQIGPRWINVGPIPSAPLTEVEWNDNEAGGVEGTGYVIEGDHIYWYRNSPGRNRKYEVVLRGRLDGVDSQGVVAEAWDQVASDDDIPELFVGMLGVGWCSSKQPTGLHFHPLPKLAL